MNEELEGIIREIDNTPLGPDELQLIQEGIDLAREYHAPKYEYRMRLRLMASLNHIGRCSDVIENFAWCLEQHNANPQDFPINPDSNIADLGWIYSWVISLLSLNNDISLTELQNSISEYLNFCQRNQLSLAHPYIVLGKIYARIDNPTAVKHYLSELELLNLKADADYCESCHMAIKAYLLIKNGEITKAIELVESYYEKKSCNVQPWEKLSELLFEIAQRDIDKAIRYYRFLSQKFAKATARVKINSSLAIFSILTGNTDDAFKIVEHNAEYLDRFSNIGHEDQFWFFLSGWLLCEALIREGRGSDFTLNFRESDLLKLHISYLGYGKPQDLVTAFKTSTLVTAQKFDERNQNSKYVQLIEYFQNLELPKVNLSSADITALERPIAPPATANEWRIRWALLMTLGDFSSAFECLDNFTLSEIDEKIAKNLQNSAALTSLPNLEVWDALRLELASLLENYCDYLAADNFTEPENDSYVSKSEIVQDNSTSITYLAAWQNRFTEISSSYAEEPLLWLSTFKALLLELLQKNPKWLIKKKLEELSSEAVMPQESKALLLALTPEYLSAYLDKSAAKTRARLALQLAREIQALQFEEMLLHKFLLWAKAENDLHFALELAKSLALLSRDRNDNLEFQLEIADICVALTDFETASEYYRKVYSLSPIPNAMLTRSLWNYALALAQTRELNEARELLEKYLCHYESYRGSTQYHNFLVKMVDFFEHYAKRDLSRKYAERNYRELSQLPTTSENAKIKAKAYYQLGVIYHQDRDNKEWQIIDSALALDYLTTLERLDIYEKVIDLLCAEEKALPMIRVLSNAAKLAYTHGLHGELKDRYIAYKIRIAKLYAKKSLTKRHQEESDLPNCIYTLFQVVNLDIDPNIRSEIAEYLAQAYEASGNLQEATNWQEYAKSLTDSPE